MTTKAYHRGDRLPGATIVEVLYDPLVAKTRYRVRYDCCGGLYFMSHYTAYTWLTGSGKPRSDSCRSCSRLKHKPVEEGSTRTEGLPMDTMARLFSYLASIHQRSAA